jgi:hypothetical protein
MASGSPSPAKPGSLEKQDSDAKLTDVKSHLSDLYSSDVSTQVQHNYTGTAAVAAKTTHSTSTETSGVMHTHKADSNSDPFASVGDAAQAKKME